jgi:uncharacterized Zn finger protein
MDNIFDKLPKGKLEIKPLDTFKCICGHYQPKVNIITKFEKQGPNTYWTIIRCLNCGQVIKKEPYKPVKSKPYEMDLTEITEEQLKRLTIGD